MEYNSLKDIQIALLSGKTTTEKLVIFYLNNIESVRDLNAYIEVYQEEALSKAKELDQKIKHHPDTLGKLFGCIISVKDLIVYKNHKVNAGSGILDGFESQFSATAIEAVLKEDAIIIGRTNCDEFGMGSANTNSHFGSVKNAVDPEKISGGSSGGAAVSVQTNTCLVALGTDTGGSVRQPASMCGVYGFKPGYGMVSRYGLIAYASSFDQLGILANNVQDIDAIMSVVSVRDDFDATMYQTGLYCEQLSLENLALDTLKIAYISDAFENDALDPEIKSTSYQFLDELKSKGATVEGIHFKLLDYVVPCYYILTTAEASSNLSRYDGVKYGHRAERAGSPEEMYVYSRSEGFGKEVKKRIMLGSFVLSEAYYDAYFTKAQQVRRLIKDQMDSFFDHYDFIIMPSSPKTAWNIHEKPNDPLEIYMADIYTVLANLAGIPAISIPLGNNTDKMPFGIQVLSRVHNDRKLLNFCNQL
jgi:aspartyl-tRNA(Asn)/glutamyl-tRNA(Gln) amidotransferase subunit A